MTTDPRETIAAAVAEALADWGAGPEVSGRRHQYVANRVFTALQSAYVPPPPGSTAKQLPADILALLVPRSYLSTACETARSLDVASIAHPDRAEELERWRDRMHQDCRLNQKYTGGLCVCSCGHRRKEAR